MLVNLYAPQKVIDDLSKRHTLKEGYVNEPNLYLGAYINKNLLLGSDNPTKTRLSMSSDDYVKPAIENLETKLDKINSIMHNEVEAHLSSGYIPELDSLKELTPRQSSSCQRLSGTLYWIYEPGRIDILVPVYLLLNLLIPPRVGSKYCMQKSRFL